MGREKIGHVSQIPPSSPLNEHPRDVHPRQKKRKPKEEEQKQGEEAAQDRVTLNKTTETTREKTGVEEGTDADSGKTRPRLDILV